MVSNMVKCVTWPPVGAGRSRLLSSSELTRFSTSVAFSAMASTDSNDIPPTNTDSRAKSCCSAWSSKS
jgi:hypothetical protein